MGNIGLKKYEIFLFKLQFFLIPRATPGSSAVFVFRDANGAVLVYDITDEDSFQKESK